MPAKSMAVVVGYWSTNIGNSFFQLGAEYLLRQALPGCRIILVSDQPGYCNVRQGNPGNALDFLSYIDMDYLVILGPYLRPEYPRIWRQTLSKLRDRGIKLVVLSAGMMDYSEPMIRAAREWLSEMPPFILVTRDSLTYDRLGDLAVHAMDGVDAATFVSDMHQPAPAALPPYVVFNFDTLPEPRVTECGPPGRQQAPEGWQPDSLRFSFPRIETSLCRRFKLFPYVRALLPHAAHAPEYLMGRLIIRTDHRFNPMVQRKVYAHPNSFVSDIPETYLDLYANTDATFTDRVHACVATLAYGRPARLFSHTPRAHLLDRLGATSIRDRLTTIDSDWLKEQKLAMVEFLRQSVQAG